MAGKYLYGGGPWLSESTTTALRTNVCARRNPKLTHVERIVSPEPIEERFWPTGKDSNDVARRFFKCHAQTVRQLTFGLYRVFVFNRMMNLPDPSGAVLDHSSLFAVE
jgi:hypothetical protein